MPTSIQRSTQGLVWQIVDSAFPVGGFAHSLGLEAAWQSGMISSRQDLGRFVSDVLLQTGYGILPLTTAAFRDPEQLQQFDELADAFLTNPVVNRASRVQGRTLAATCARIWPSAPLERLQRSMGSLAGHVAPITGVALQTIGLPLWTIQEIVLFTTARSVLSAAVRLGIVGSYDAQRLQSESTEYQASVLDRCADLDIDDLAQTTPILDLVHASHDRLYSRLFQS